VVIPSLPLISMLYLSQALNVILLVPLLFVLNRLSGDRALMGEHASGGLVGGVAWAATAELVACVVALGVVSAIRHARRPPAASRGVQLHHV
jgi:Mn2+/Fe2+ NRAMP family transporter